MVPPGKFAVQVRTPGITARQRRDAADAVSKLHSRLTRLRRPLRLIQVALS